MRRPKRQERYLKCVEKLMAEIWRLYSDAHEKKTGKRYCGPGCCVKGANFEVGMWVRGE